MQHTRDRARELAITLARAASDSRCVNVVVLDVTSISPVTDFLMLGTGTSPRQMRSVADDCAEAAEALKYSMLASSGYDGSNWICADFVDVVLHVFSQESRAYYDLDNLWADATKVDWETGREEARKREAAK